MKYLKFLISPIFMGILFIVFAVAMAVATFLENDFGSPAAYRMVYETRWFELILLLLAVNLAGQMITFRLYRKEKVPGFLFHFSFLVMLAGAAITRYAGWEGSMHIREGAEQNECISSEKYIIYNLKAAGGGIVDSDVQKYSMTSVAADDYKRKIGAGGRNYELVLSRIIPNALEVPEGHGGSQAIAMNPAEQHTGQNAFIFTLSDGSDSQTIYLWDREDEAYGSASADVNGNTLELTYGSKVTKLPFVLRLNDFILDRYPGSNSPSGYKSDVVLVDKANGVEKPYMIFMNNILKYKGYRFYQSSYDPDEKGTILSVSHDRAGMFVTYAGYGLLFLFILLSLLNPNSIFRTVTAAFWQSGIRKGAAVVAALLLLSGLGTASAQKFVPDKAASEEFGKVLVQDQKGRTKPLFTLSNDILRKVTHENSFQGMTSMQVFLGFYLDFNNWKDVPMIRVTGKDLQDQLRLRGNMARFSDFVTLGGEGATYRISDLVNAAYSKDPGSRTKTDKEIMKVDERVNILYMIYTGDFLRLFPLRDTTDHWGSPSEALQGAKGKEDSTYIAGISTMMTDALSTNNLTGIKNVERSIGEYQKRFASYELPSAGRIKTELLYYRLSIFERLFPYYGAVGFAMLAALIIMVIRGRQKKSLFVRVTGWLLFAGFLFHTLGLGMRWYISGHSPMSNGYESLIFISWVTLLAGFIFSRKSLFALAATGVLGSMTLLVAHLSFMDPEITNLVPVLKSYWLTLHVSVIISSYGFLGLGAILSLIVMVLLSLAKAENRNRISATIDQLTVINYQSLTLGLYFLTIGTFLGAIWANESWGRYWGWDPKETWSLITIVIYSIAIHSRLIPGMKDIFTFNLVSLFAFSSVLMTYFGVNYYLSGMHSYAGGDPVPVPVFVYVAVVLLTALAWFAHFRYSKLSGGSK